MKKMDDLNNRYPPHATIMQSSLSNDESTRKNPFTVTVPSQQHHHRYQPALFTNYRPPPLSYPITLSNTASNNTTSFWDEEYHETTPPVLKSQSSPPRHHHKLWFNYAQHQQHVVKPEKVVNNKERRHRKQPNELLSESQKKANHIASEQKRRHNIRIGYDQLVGIVPSLNHGNRSEALILQKSVDHIQRLISLKTQLKNQVRDLQGTLGDDIEPEDSSGDELLHPY